MIFDSKEQKDRVLDLIGEVPITTTIKGLVSGVSPELAALLDAIQRGQVMSVDDQTVLMLKGAMLERVSETFDGEHE